MANTRVYEWSTTAASNTDINSNNIAEGCAPSGINNAIRELMRQVRIEVASQGSDIASAGTTDIGAATGQYVKVTGTTTITALGTVNAGTTRWVEFTGALTLTHNATSLKLPGSANITTAAGDVACFVSLGSGNWKCLGYWPVSGGMVTAQKITIRSVTGTDTLLASDLGKIVDATSGTFTWSITAAATLGAGWWCYVKNSGTGVPTLDPNSSETVDGLTTLPLATTEGFILYCDGSNFKTIGRDRAGSRTVTGTTDTITPADNGRIISYTNTGGCTITVSALATLGAGFYCDIDNSQATSTITLNRSGADVFEGNGTAVTLAAFANDGRSRIRLETRAAGLLYTSLRQFRSAAQTITAAAQVQVAHGLGAVPKKYWLVLRCTTAELGYSVGDEVIYPTAGATLSAGAVANAGAAMRADATNLTVRFGSLAATLNVTRADTGAGANITLGSWAAHLCGEF